MKTRILLVPAVLVAALLAPVSAAQAAGAEVTVADMAFTPARVTVGLGQSVTWTFTDQMAHTTTSNQGFWNSGSKSDGDTFARAFTSAGTFGYHCSFHSSMTGAVRVPLKANGSAADGWTLRWSTKRAGSGRNFDIQVKEPGTSAWRWYRIDEKGATASFDPARSGTWKVRARTSNTDAGKNSGWSPVTSVAVS